METYLAHQLPDKAGMYATMLGLAVLMFLFDWRMGLLCLATMVLALIVMLSLMTGPTPLCEEFSCVLAGLAGVQFVEGRGEAFLHHLLLRGCAALLNLRAKREHRLDEVPHRAAPPVVGYCHCCHDTLSLSFSAIVTARLCFYCALRKKITTFDDWADGEIAVIMQSDSDNGRVT